MWNLSLSCYCSIVFVYTLWHLPPCLLENGTVEKYQGCKIKNLNYMHQLVSLFLL